MNEAERLKRAKSYVDKLINGVNPLDGSQIPDSDVVREYEIVACLSYISRILEQNIVDFNRFDLVAEGCTTANIRQSVCDVLGNPHIITDEQIEQWLCAQGCLIRNIQNIYIPTAEGEQLGISRGEYDSDSGKVNCLIYSPNAQKFVYDNVGDIIKK